MPVALAPFVTDTLLVRRSGLVGMVAALTTMAVVSPQPASSADYTFRVDSNTGTIRSIGSFRPLAAGASIGAATRAFGATSERDEKSGYCRVRWRRPNVTIDFVNFGAGQAPVCSDDYGFAQNVVARGRAFRTRRGLRPGMRTTQVPRRHPAAESRRGSWWLNTFVYPFGDDTEQPILRATVRNGRVYALAGYIGAGGE